MTHPIERGMIDGHTPLAHPLLKLPVRNRVRYVSPYAPQNYVPSQTDSP